MAPTDPTGIVAGTDNATQPREAVARTGFTLRAKGILALAALLAYSGLVGIYVIHEREKMQQIVHQVQAIHDDIKLIIGINASLTHALVSLQDVLNSDDVTSRWGEVDRDVASYYGQLPQLRTQHPETADAIRRVEEATSSLNRLQSRTALIALRDGEQALAAAIERIEDAKQEEARMLSQRYSELSRFITVFVATMNVVGLVAFGMAATLFFTRVAADLNRLKERALAVAGGYRGEPLKIVRGDEVGHMMSAVNQMQRELALRERQQEISRQQRFHQEKMAAIGSLASAVAHEVGNPINSISGIAQHTIDALDAGRLVDEQTMRGNAKLTIQQTERIAAILRNLSDLSAPRSAQPQLLDLNELLRTTCSFLRYDKRFRNIDLAIEEQADLPAVRAVADHLTQVVMNLVINAADAMEGVSGRKPAIRVTARRAGDYIALTVSDNGQGMKPETLEHAFEQSFTTKPAGKGRGIGLYLCKMLIEEMGGRIELQSTIGEGTVANVQLRVDPPAAEG